MAGGNVPLSNEKQYQDSHVTLLKNCRIIGYCSAQERGRSTGRNVRFGSKADICTAIGHVRFTPHSDIKCDIWNVRWGAKADIGSYRESVMVDLVGGSILSGVAIRSPASQLDCGPTGLIRQLQKKIKTRRPMYQARPYHA